MSPSRLSPLDASFLAVETPTAHMHVGWAAVFDPPDDGPAPSFEDLRAHIAARLPRAPRYRQRILSVPLELGAPVWADDPEFDIARHVVRARTESLAGVVDECMSEPLGREHPLWQICIAPRLEDGRIAVVGKAHHCMVDGIAAVELSSLLLDPESDPPDPQAGGWSPEPLPGRVGLARDAAIDLARRELDLAMLPARLARSPRRLLQIASRARRAATAVLEAARPARPTRPFNDEISPRRHLAMLRRKTGDLVDVKRAFGVKLNDVMLAACAGGVRRFLRRRGEDPVPLKTMVPVNVRDGADEGELGNRISFMFVDLPCDEPDSVRRLDRIHGATTERKQREEPEGGDAVVRSLGFVPRPLQRVVSRAIASPRTFNLVASNIPGPRETLYMRGCPLEEAYPVVPIADRHSLSIGMTTVRDGAFFGLYADRESLPDADGLAEDIDAEIDELLEVADEGAASHAVETVTAG